MTNLHLWSKQIFKHWEVGQKGSAAPPFFNQLQSVWNETLLQVFDIASQSIANC